MGRRAMGTVGVSRKYQYRCCAEAAAGGVYHGCDRPTAVRFAPGPTWRSPASWGRALTTSLELIGSQGTTLQGICPRRGKPSLTSQPSGEAYGT